MISKIKNKKGLRRNPKAFSGRNHKFKRFFRPKTATFSSPKNTGGARYKSGGQKRKLGGVAPLPPRWRRAWKESVFVYFWDERFRIRFRGGSNQIHCGDATAALISSKEAPCCSNVMKRYLTTQTLLMISRNTAPNKGLIFLVCNNTAAVIVLKDSFILRIEQTYSNSPNSLAATTSYFFPTNIKNTNRPTILNGTFIVYS